MKKLFVTLSMLVFASSAFADRGEHGALAEVYGYSSPMKSLVILIICAIVFFLVVRNDSKNK